MVSVGSHLRKPLFLVAFLYQVIEARQKEIPYLLPEDVFVEKPRSAGFTIEYIFPSFLSSDDSCFGGLSNKLCTEIVPKGFCDDQY